MIVIAAFVVAGLLIGSFLNVVIARLPEGRSLVRPGSACPGCGAAIAWHDNVPVISFLALRGRCRACAMLISWRYPLVEAVTGALFGAAALAFGPTLDAAVASALLAALVAITLIDLERQIIPDAISLPGILAGLLANLATGRVSWLDSVLGIVVGGGVFLAIAVVGSWLAGQDAMGGGDIKLAAMLGAFLGWKVLLLSLFVSAIGGGILAALLMGSGLRGRKDPLPFGPFLAAGGAVGLFWGERMVRWYLSGFGGS
ncbi:MAG: prepilin peptidase [Candidatus Rokuibacteriota bacterium]|nr:MAG: prepilin peptidase [Candidatus Rokubacteria bacterium]